MTRKKNPKNKRQTPGVFISNLLGSGNKSNSSQDSSRDKEGEKKKYLLEPATVDDQNSLEKVQSVVLCRTVLELALVNIVLGQQETHCQGSGQYKIMAPPASTSSGGSGLGLSKLMSPVQDLGKSLLGFLLGSQQSQNNQQQSSQEQQPQPPSRRTSAILHQGDTLERKRDSLVLPTSPGRQRPPGHPALPSVSSTPVVIRRNKVERSQTMSLESASLKNVVPEETEPLCSDADSAVVNMSAEKVQRSRKQQQPSQQKQQQQQYQQKQQQQQSQQKQQQQKQETKEETTQTAKPRSQSRSSRRRKAKREAAQRCLQQQLQQQSSDINESSLAVEPNQENHDTSVPQASINNETHESESVADEKQSENVTTSDKADNITDADDHETVAKNNDTETTEIVNSENGDVPAESSHEVMIGQYNCHAEDEAGQETKRVSRKQLIQVQDEVDKDNLDVAEAVAASTQSRPGCGGDQTCVIPTPPPPPPPGFLGDCLKLEQNNSIVDDKLLPPKSCGTLRKNKQLSRKDVLINQLTEVDDSFALFLKSQLNISVDARERTGAETAGSYINHHETLNTRKKKLRRQRTESESSVTGASSSSGVAEVKTETVSPDKTESACDPPSSVDVRSEDQTEISEKDKQPAAAALISVENKKKCEKNIRDRPLSIIDFEELSATNTIAAAAVIVEEDNNKPSETVVDQGVSQEEEKADKCLEKPDKTDKDPINKMTVTDSVQSGADTDTGDMGVGLSAQHHEFSKETGVITEMITKQHLSKSDSGYSGYIDKSSDDNEEDHDHTEDDDSPAKSELTVDQAMMKYNRIVEKKSVSETRTRVMSEGSEFSEDMSDSEPDSQCGKFVPPPAPSQLGHLSRKL